MPAKRYIVSLTPEERQSLEQLTRTGKTAAAKINHARILLKADINNADGSWKDQDISNALNISVKTIERVRQRFVEEGLERALTRRSSPSLKLKKIDGETEAHLIEECLFSSTCRVKPLDITTTSRPNGSFGIYRKCFL
jgi:hypothetical protein